MSDADPTGPGGRRPNSGRPKGTKATPLATRERLLNARADKERNLADLRALELRMKAGELVDKAKATLALQTIVANARARFLALPSRAAPSVIAMTAPEAEAFLRDLVHEALTELAAGREAP